MKAIRRTTQFKKDIKRTRKRGKDFARLKDVITRLARGETLADRFHDHPLVGDWKGARDCHIEPDWLLIYAATDDELVLIRTGTHADLFKK